MITTSAADELLHRLQVIHTEAKVDRRAPSVGTAYLFWFFTGTLGVHRFYLGHTESGAIMLAINIMATVFALGTWREPAMLMIPLAMVACVAIWALVDVVRIPAMVSVKRAEIRREVINECMWGVD